MKTCQKNEVWGCLDLEQRIISAHNKNHIIIFLHLNESRCYKSVVEKTLLWLRNVINNNQCFEMDTFGIVIDGGNGKRLLPYLAWKFSSLAYCFNIKDSLLEAIAWKKLSYKYICSCKSPHSKSYVLLISL